MKWMLVPLMLLLTATSPAARPQTYLLSIGNIALKPGEAIEGFSVETWGVRLRSVCQIPDGWRMTAGNSATPNGELQGQGSQGATWFHRSSPVPLRNLVLVTLYGPVQSRDVRSHNPEGIVPATFKGSVLVSTDDGEQHHPLDARSITLKPAHSCPASR